jgi:hypothetical protein
MVRPVYEQNFQATEFLLGSGVFCIARRLTALGGARNIVRIRTNTPAAANRDDRCRLTFTMRRY